ncbi:MAG: phospho-N-acetylmuramoyl-pentapeptide-transferase [Lachnospiraceae bacterium]|nr:phospho-N-acetylmuramoyl-pentapeptide-transferase [Lachnospiraceae bacterium]
MKFALPAVLAFAFVAVSGPKFIEFLRKLKASQTEREYLESHVAKSGTPTMGGIMILIGFILGCFAMAYWFPRVIPVVILTVGFGIIGFIDDYLKVVMKSADGLLAWQKLLLQIVVTAVFYFYLKSFTDVSVSKLIIPFTGGNTVDIGWVGIPLLFFAVIGTVNGTNFTDGLDGLASSVTAVVALFFAAASIKLGGMGVESAGMAMFGALLGFLLFNHYPAKVFMGDTGSLALGGFVSGMAYMMGMPLFILLVGLIYFVEVLSVMLQVSYFKITHGKRIFRMAPIHHHFEKGGWSEVKIVAVFTAITLVMAIIAFFAL